MIARGRVSGEPTLPEFPRLIMADPNSDNDSSDTSLYQEFLAERDEILRHKWLKSEDVGRDIGFDAALVDWTLEHRSDWKKDQQRRLRA